MPTTRPENRKKKAKQPSAPSKRTIVPQESSNSASPMNAERLRKLYSTMMKCRMVSERSASLFGVDTTASAGHEAAEVGACIHLLENDLVSPTSSLINGNITKGAAIAELFATLQAGPNAASLIDMLRRVAAPQAALAAAPPQLVDLPAFLIRRAAQAASTVFAETAGADALPGLDYSILLLLDQNLVETQADLLFAISTFRSSTMPALKRLETAGLIERATALGDRRRRHLRATPAGIARLRKLDQPIEAYEAAFLSPLDPAEARQLYDGLLRIADTD